MTDLDRAIRERLDDCALPGMRWIPVMGLTSTWPTTDFAAFQKKAVQLESAPGQMRDALFAVLDLHYSADEQDAEWDHGPHWPCAVCHDGPWPCETLRTIAEKLGMEHD